MNLVTGATGILGRRIVMDLLKREQKVRAVKRVKSDLQDVLASFEQESCVYLFRLIEWIEVDFSDDTSIDMALKDVDNVYHCMSKVSLNPKDKEEIYRTNIYETFQFINRVKNAKIKKFCYFSALSALNLPNNEGVFTEDSFMENEMLMAYTESKIKVEKVLKIFSEKYFPYIIIYPAFIIGSGNWGESSGVLFTWFEKTKYMLKNTYSSYVDVRDVSKSSIELMESTIENEQFVLIADTVDNIKLENIVKKEFKKPPALEFSPIFLKMLIGINRIFSLKIKSFQFINSQSLNFLLKNAYYSNQKIKKAIGIKFITPEESVKYYVKQYYKYRNNL